MLTGDLSQLDGMMEALNELSTVPSRTAGLVSGELYDAIQEQFDAGVDPYGDPWAPLAPSTEARGRSMPPGLDDSGSMRDTLVVAPLPGAGVGITIDKPANFHQTGWDASRGVGVPRPVLARPVLPFDGLPEHWVDIIDDAAAREFRKVMK